MNFEFVTDTSTVCIYDLECLKHRLSDDPDWWAEIEEELLEENRGNVAFVGLPEDGKYRVEIAEKLDDCDIKVDIRIPSGRVFIGAGEEVTSDDLEPSLVRGGAFIELNAGNYSIHMCANGCDILIAFVPGGEGRNFFDRPLKIK